MTIKRSLGVYDDDDSTLKQAQALDPFLTIIPPDILELQRAAGEDTLSIEKSRSRWSRAYWRLAGSKPITGQEALVEHRERHGPSAGIPALAAWDPTPELHLWVGVVPGTSST